jgi:hypothetical protein
LGIDRVDDLRLAVSESAGRLIRAGEQQGSLRASFSVDPAGLHIQLALRNASIPRWPLGPDADPLSWIVIETLTDAAEEALDGEDPCIGMHVSYALQP